jgi:hypothetical protein
MAIVMTMRVPDGFGMYDQLNQEMGVESDLPSGLIHHYAAKDGNDLLIWDIWESKEDFERFMNERLMPAFQKLSGGEAPPEGGPEPQFAELHNEFPK